jgi:hypothetical protein
VHGHAADLDVRVLTVLHALAPRDAAGDADARDLAMSLLPLCAGRKSEKLGAALAALGGEGGCARLFCALLIAFAVVQAHPAAPTAGALGATASQARLLDESVARACERTGGACTFEDFARWYATSGGGCDAQWLELLSLPKLGSLL